MHSVGTLRSSLAITVVAVLSIVTKPWLRRMPQNRGFDTYCISKTCACGRYVPLSREQARAIPPTYKTREELYVQLSQQAVRVNRLLGAWQAAAREIQKNPNADGARADHLKIGYNDAHKNYQAEMRRFATRMNSYRTQRAAVQIAETPQTLAPFQAAAGALNSRRPMAVLAPPANARGVGEVTALEQAKQDRAVPFLACINNKNCMLGHKEAQCASNGGRVVKIEQFGN